MRIEEEDEQRADKRRKKVLSHLIANLENHESPPRTTRDIAASRSRLAGSMAGSKSSNTPRDEKIPTSHTKRFAPHFLVSPVPSVGHPPTPVFPTNPLPWPLSSR